MPGLTQRDPDRTTVDPQRLRERLSRVEARAGDDAAALRATVGHASYGVGATLAEKVRRRLEAVRLAVDAPAPPERKA